MDNNSSTTYSTSIQDLPINPVGNDNTKNVSFSTTEATSNNITLDQTTINQIINGLQQAGSSTQLQSRDIPMSMDHLVQDPNVQVNYIPPVQNSAKDYIQEEENNEDIVDNYNKHIQKIDKLDQMYNELQIPILISLLFFIFQLPIFKKLLFAYFPILHFKDGNINLYGYTFKSVLFGLFYYILVKLMNYFNTF